jgi:integrase
MARSQRSSTLDNRTARLKLAMGTRKFVTIGKGLALCYRRTEARYGTWQARAWDGRRYHYGNLGRADDYQDANGDDMLDYYQAQGRARDFFEEVTNGHKPKPSDATVADAVANYLAWYKEHRRAYRETETTINAHILPALGEYKLSDLTATALRSWRDKLAARPARIRTGKHARKQSYKPAPVTDEAKRQRRASANRIMNVLKAALNRAFDDGLVLDRTPWQKVKPFPKADEARIRFLTDAEAVRLVNASAPDLRRLVQAALLTGARFGELASMQAQDVNLRTAQVYVARSKSGKPRHIPLNAEGKAHFRELIAGKTGEQLVFTKADGSAWGKNHHVRPLKEACDRAKVRPEVAFHELRHTYASHLAQAGVDLLTIAKLLGHADTRITAKHYAHLADKTLAAAVTRLPSFSGEATIVEEVKPSRKA